MRNYEGEWNAYNVLFKEACHSNLGCGHDAPTWVFHCIFSSLVHSNGAHTVAGAAADKKR